MDAGSHTPESSNFTASALAGAAGAAELLQVLLMAALVWLLEAHAAAGGRGRNTSAKPSSSSSLSNSMSLDVELCTPLMSRLTCLD
jgi:hypothetical protein